VRVCLDRNVLVAAFATRGLCADVLRTVLSEHELVLGEVIQAELRRALERKIRLPADQIEAVEAVFAGFDLVPTPSEPSSLAIRDRDDRSVAATAVEGHADVLVTGDNALLAIAAEAPLPILAPRAFWELLRRGKSR
jgi:putative PIN family toxin of toxin-antitoxin system